MKNRRLDKNQTVARALYDAGLDEVTVTALHGALSAAEFNFKKARPGDQLRFVFRHGQLDVLDYRRSLLTEWQVRRDGDRYVARKREIEREQRIELVDLTVESNVWDAAISAGERPDIAVTLSDVFAWDVDFYRDVQKGDRMRAVVEKVIHKGRTLEYGRVLAAEYMGRSVGTKKSFRYKMPDGTETFFTEDGLSARKTFLKSPLKYATVTSGFGSRFHPVLNYVGNHNGVDYHAPSGTPVWAVSDGTVVRAGWNDGGGNVVCIKHVMSFETCYMHLSKILVKVGQRIAQKTVLAESGNTGKLTTGPHLHFGLKRGGGWVNPLSQNFPRAEPLPKQLMEDFKQQIADAASRLAASRVVLKGN
ncbi:MAG: M23 family metallopeptidase [Archangium sp.]|nr:M23 family metallopeptidase [Archangium sp.]MDP3156241.1 M23 family metallopeptidase [Archangium sp.]MDP3571578.1 M23 family metallopeptidase [Archangium sp.]